MSCRVSLDSRRRRNHHAGGMTRNSFAGDGLPQTRATDNDEIKDYAEHTMNEMLGWYGYGNVNKTETQASRRHQSSSSSSPQPPEASSPPEDDISDDLSDAGSSVDVAGSDIVVDECCNINSTTTIICAWCHKKGLKLFTLKTSSGQLKTFCSELCFDQCRRAAFKKNRTCDWCKHIRHTVNYVDFQDKDHQLQFCSDKCLNQYKMNIFCRETQAYLQLHPQEIGSANPGCSRSNSPNLITPDLWLKDCKGTIENGEGSNEDEAAKQEPSSSGEEQGDTVSDLSSRASDDSKIKRKDLEPPPKPERRSSRHRPVSQKPRSSPLLIPEVRPPNRQYHHPEDMSLRTQSPPSLHNGYTTRRSMPFHSSIPRPSLQPSLPPPPPLLNSEMLHSPFPHHPYPESRPFLPPHSARHHNYRPPYQEMNSSLPLNLSSAAQSVVNPPPPSSITLPYPLVIPFPVPIPIPVPIPLSQFLNLKADRNKTTSTRTVSAEHQAKRVDGIISRLMNKISTKNDHAQDIDKSTSSISRTEVPVDKEDRSLRKSKHRKSSDYGGSKRPKLTSNL